MPLYRVHQDPTLPQGFCNTFRKRFWEGVNKDGPIQPHTPELGQCWEWIKSTDNGGYGALSRGWRPPKLIKAHRASWVIHNGEIPLGLDCLHKCDNRKCVRPDHLFLGKDIDNIHDCMKKGRFHKRPLIGEKANGAKITASDVLEIRRLHPAIKLKELGKRFNLDPSYVSLVYHRKRWKHIP